MQINGFKNSCVGKSLRLFKRSVCCAILAVFCLPFATTSVVSKPCENTRVDLRGDWGQANFNVTLADTTESRALGLMHVEHLPEHKGMLFIYPGESKVAFWMKNTLIPLDMLFFDATGKMTGLHKNAQPHDLTPKVGGEAVKYVLEINGGLSKALGINQNTVLRHPALAGAGIWPCGVDE